MLLHYWCLVYLRVALQRHGKQTYHIARNKQYLGNIHLFYITMIQYPSPESIKQLLFENDRDESGIEFPEIKLCQFRNSFML